VGIVYPREVKTSTSEQLTIVEQLAAAYDRTGWSLDELSRRVAAVGLDLDRTTLKKKLVGKCGTTTKQAEIMAVALGATLAWVPARSRSRAA
jgi:hypothetical protein